MNRVKARRFVNRHTKTGTVLDGSNFHFSNINNKESVWWFRIHKTKFEMDLYLLLNHKSEMIILHIPRNTFSSPKKFCIREEKNGAVYADLDIYSNEDDKRYMCDIKNGDSLYDFSQHIHERIRLKAAGQK